MSRPHNAVPRTAIVPAAGLGTRFLPATKTVPKELLPVVDTPGIELVAAEAAEAGAERLVIVTSEGKDGVVAHFVEDLVLEGTLEARGKKAMLAKVRRAPQLIAVVRDEELVDELPSEPHDVRMTHALTPRRGLIALDTPQQRE